MTLLNKKLLLAPILAIALAFLLAGAIISLPFLPESASQGQSSPMPQETQALNGSILPILFIAAAIVVGIVTVFLFFREKTLRKAINE